MGSKEKHGLEISTWESLTYRYHLNHGNRQGHQRRECGVKREGSQDQALFNSKGQREKEKPAKETEKKYLERGKKNQEHVVL